MAPDIEARLAPTVGDAPFGERLLKGLVTELLRRLENPEIAAALSASEMELIRKVCTDNSITLASIQRGDFGETARRAATEFPFEVIDGDKA